jgi:hypothetical protein
VRDRPLQIESDLDAQRGEAWRRDFVAQLGTVPDNSAIEMPLAFAKSAGNSNK